GYIAAGQIGANAYAVKLDSSGTFEYEATFSGVKIRSVQQTSDGGYIMAGYYVYNSGLGDIDLAYLIKTDSALDTAGSYSFSKGWSGNQSDKWQQTFDMMSRAYSVQETSGGEYIITGRKQGTGFPPGYDGYLVKTNSAGGVIWDEAYDGGDNDCFYSVKETADGEFIVAGINHAVDTSPYWLNSDIWILKIDSTDGGIIDQSTFSNGSTKTDYAFSVDQTSDGGYILAGKTTDTASGHYDAYLIKTDSNLDMVFEKRFGGGSADDDFRSVIQTSDGGYIMSGYSIVFGVLTYVVKTDQLGNCPQHLSPSPEP
ncbi:MAG: hypothetical protein HQ572_05770, partial [Candidatus Omnitrophica bacterium]|nr:hypothetical protein [Candidatus Omnitrophota bacterium]